MARQLDMCKTPWNAMKLIEAATNKEILANELRAKKRLGLSMPSSYKLQAPTEQVMLSGLTRRPEWNGLLGQIVSVREDDAGFLQVRLTMSNGEYRTVKAQPRCLEPVRHPKDTRARGGHLTAFEDKQHFLDAEQRVSMLSMASPASILGYGKSASSVLSASAPLDRTSQVSRASPAVVSRVSSLPALPRASHS
ncbi:unnamed protein product [Polarella glacialis]|uniref:Uncharacterized protein n=1 Tax=Polarella glacialis TaxID=89957 RepID=A0A813I0K6_POLGL|nr:unnamed protein product [Polarella glacialis]